MLRRRVLGMERSLTDARVMALGCVEGFTSLTRKEREAVVGGKCAEVGRHKR